MYVWRRIRAKPFTAVILHWDEPRIEQTAEVTILFTLDPRFRNSGLFLLKMADRFFYSRSPQEAKTDAERAVNALLRSTNNDEAWRVREIPSKFSDDVQLFLGFAQLASDQVYSDYALWRNDDRLLPCKMDFNSDGPVFTCKYSRRLMLKRQPARLAELLEIGRPVLAVRLMANHKLYEPGSCDGPGRVIFTFDDRISKLPDYLMDLRNRMTELRDRKPTTDDERLIRAHLDDLDDQHVYRRFRVPHRYAGGRVAYSAGIQFVRRYLPEGYLRYEEDLFFPCMAESGEHGAIEMIPPRMLED